MSGTREPARMQPWLVALLFFASGFAALTYEVLWQRELGLLFGNSSQATAGTLIAFFLGMALGNWILGRRSARWRDPLRAFAFLELGVAVTALLALGLLPLYREVFPWLYGAFGDSRAAFLLVKGLLAALLLLPPAFLMGGTLPALQEMAVRAGSGFARSGSFLYAWNTFGAAAGALVAGFVLPRALGYRGSYLVAIGVSASVALVAWTRSRTLGAIRPVAPADTAASARASIHVYAVAVLSGFAALALQVLWTRMFALGLQNSVYTFAAVVVVFLVGLALGAVVANRLVRTQWDPHRVLRGLLVFACFAVALSAITFRLMVPRPGAIGESLSFGPYVGEALRVLAFVLLFPITALGIVFPYLLRAESVLDAGPAGRRIGRLVALNTVGALCGALVAGFLLPGWLGLWPSIAAVAGLYLLAALSLRAHWLPNGLVAIGVGLLVTHAWAEAGRGRDWLGSVRGRLIAVYEGSGGTVSVVDRRGHLKLRLDNSYTLGGSAAPRWERYQAHIPMALHPAPRDVFFLGMGTGITAGAALAHPVATVTVTELLPQAVRGAREHFAPWAGGLFEDPRADLIVEDGRTVLAGSESRYDVVIGDLFLPWKRGVGSLYTVEMFRAARSSLRERGIFAQWIPLFQMSAEEFRGIARSFVEVFPQATLWRGDFFARRPIVALVGHRTPGPLDPDSMIASFDRLEERGDVSFGGAVFSLPFMLYAGNLGAYAPHLQDARRNTDDRPWIELEAPMSQRARKAGEAGAFTGRALAAFEREVLGDVDRDPLLERLSRRQKRMVEGGMFLYEYAAADSVRDAEGRGRAQADYLIHVPAAVRPELRRWVD